jgi:hydroxymethylbilane synthase
VPVRGNVPTRLSRLVEGKGDALVVAKAALDRLLGFGAPFEAAAAAVRHALDASRWMVLPLRDVPGAPAQGAVAIEMAASGGALVDRVKAISHEPTWREVQMERDVLAAAGGGCHSALGATALLRPYGRVMSVRADRPLDNWSGWSLADAGPAPPRASDRDLWPRPDERTHAQRRPLRVAPLEDDCGYCVARAEALPEHWPIEPHRLVWAAGGKTWRRLAARGVWVHGCADGLGDVESPKVDLLAGRQVNWRRLTHEAAAEEGALATYAVEDPLPDDLAGRTHFFWTSGRQFLDALDRWPELHDRWHGSGPGRTSHVVRKTLGPAARARVWLDYEQWYQEVTT